MSESLYTLKHLDFYYSPKHYVFCNVQQSYAEGKITVIHGPSGIGKTTLLKILNRLLIPQAGTIYYRGIPITKKTCGILRDETVYVHQNPLMLSGTVFKNVAYGMQVRGKAKQHIQEQVHILLDLVGLADYKQRNAHQLSGGEIQRIAIARALAIMPRVLLLDEPTAHLDLENIQKIQALLKHIHSNLGTTMLISTHNESFGKEIGDDMVYLKPML
jgi:ABC-type methionine transport system ATPase subunit